jgi:hypothetical protein
MIKFYIDWIVNDKSTSYTLYTAVIIYLKLIYYNQLATKSTAPLLTNICFQKFEDINEVIGSSKL